MYPRKGAIVEGADADVIVWDPEATKTISAGSQQSAIDYNVFEGITVKGLPKYVLTRGEIAVDNGKVQARPGHGQFVGREPFMAANKALSTWKELVAPRKVERSGIPASGV
jgi:dihydropyrimidinase